MPTGVSWSPDHTDITNYYLKMGVIGGLPLMGLLIAALLLGFQYIGQSLRLSEKESWEQRFMIWSVGAALLSHVATCISVSYFDQSYIFLFVNLALIGSLRSAILLQEVVTEENENREEDEDEPGRDPQSEVGARPFGIPSDGVAGFRFG
jgi:predicted membrane protein